VVTLGGVRGGGDGGFKMGGE
ncbi:hypothetical protein A2U01_0088849, partial [Trifolium medium]|nr:hypothetical protein [Trifolium medium]